MEEKKYIVVKKSTIEELENEVNELIEKGYEPIGGMFRLGYGQGHGYSYAQTVYKAKEQILKG